MSTINTSAINISYPVPGNNNNSQGFRDNFAAIKNNLDTAGSEITNLQQNVVVKSGLTGIPIDNNMADTLISNALTKSFRATTYNLGNSLSGTVLIDVSKGDVQYGTIAANTTLNFSGWALEGMQCGVELQLQVSNANAVITFAEQVYDGNVANTRACLGATSIESFTNVANRATVTVPYGVCQLDYRLSSVDCGNSITIEPVNRPRKASQLRQRTPAPTGLRGDTAGTVAVDANYIYVCSGTYDSTEVSKTISATYSGNLINCTSTASLVVNAPIVFDTTAAGLTAGTTYYIKTMDSANITVSSTGFDGLAGAALAITPVGSLAVGATSYNGTSIWRRVDLATVTGDDTVTGNLTVNGIANFANVANLRIGGAGVGYYLQTDGAGNLSWDIGTTVAGVLAPGGSNTFIQYDNAGSFGGSAGFTFNNVSNVVNTPGAIIAAGNITSGNVITGVTAVLSGNITVANLAASGLMTVVGNITGGNITTANLLSAGNMYATGNITALANINASNINGSTNGSHNGPVGLVTADAGLFTTILAGSDITAGANIAVTGNVTVTGNSTANNSHVTGLIRGSANAAITATGTNQVTAAAATNCINVITVASAGTGVILPAAEAGLRVIVRNGPTGNMANVYPGITDLIGANLANVPYALPVSTSIEFFCSASTPTGQWFTLT